MRYGWCRIPSCFLKRIRKFLRQSRFLALMMVLQKVAQRMNRIEQQQDGFPT